MDNKSRSKSSVVGTISAEEAGHKRAEEAKHSAHLREEVKMQGVRDHELKVMDKGVGNVTQAFSVFSTFVSKMVEMSHKATGETETKLLSLVTGLSEPVQLSTLKTIRKLGEVAFKAAEVVVPKLAQLESDTEKHIYSAMEPSKAAFWNWMTASSADTRQVLVELVKAPMGMKLADAVVAKFQGQLLDATRRIEAQRFEQSQRLKVEEEQKSKAMKN